MFQSFKTVFNYSNGSIDFNHWNIWNNWNDWSALCGRMSSQAGEIDYEES